MYVCQITALLLFFAPPLWGNVYHPTPRATKEPKNPDELPGEFWVLKAQGTLKEHTQRNENKGVAKNVILFLGDGMSVPTLAAARMYLGEENSQLSFEKFPHTALSKTYCVDKQVADSACTATAYLSGIKANSGTIGVTANIPNGDCVGMTNTSNHVLSIAHHAQLKGKSTGLVTTVAVTDASPAGVYAHTSRRSWETDTDITNDNNDPKICQDIASQLIKNQVGKNLNVIMGGGRRNFLPKETKDEDNENGWRSDKENLIDTWLKNKQAEKQTAEYVSNRAQLLNRDNSTTNVLGLFKTMEMNYYGERNHTTEPSLVEMTDAAIKVLSKNPNGFFLFVEGGLIDRAHHEGQAWKALEETYEFSTAIQRAVNLTSEEDTLIVVTSDHAHTMSYSGYPDRGNDILGVGGESDVDGLPYLTISYANGPGYKKEEAGKRHDVSKDTLDRNYHYPSAFPSKSETHGGDDVMIFARGPWSHLFSGVLEQNVIPHFMSFAACVGEGDTACTNGGIPHFYPSVVLLLLTLYMSVCMM